MSDEYERFITTVAEQADLSWQAAERASRATLETLAERIAAGEARDLAAQLPPEVAAWVHTTTDAESFDADEFVRRIADREGVDPMTAERHAAAVFAALPRTVGRKEMRDVASELSRDFEPLLAHTPGAHPTVMSVDAFVAAVSARTGLDDARARRAIDAVLETLAERIAGGEVADLMSQLPVAFHPPLKRGVESSGGKATRMSLEGFVHRVAEREGITEEDALDHARAVLTTLREAVADGEFYDVTAELPDEYDVLLATR